MAGVSQAPPKEVPNEDIALTILTIQNPTHFSPAVVNLTAEGPENTHKFTAPLTV